MIYGNCAFCGYPVEGSPCYPVKGWEPLREGGGANRIIDRQRDESKVAHQSCAESAAQRHRRGISDQQGTLV